ncbi:MAG: hypothetical protein WDM90_25040 [Ferruginibacter sp.]
MTSGFTQRRSFFAIQLNVKAMENLPAYVDVLFILTTILTLIFFYKASGNSKKTIAIILCWLALQAIAGLAGFYKVTNSTPPRFMFLILPPLVFITILFISANGRRYIGNFNIKTLTLLHIVRIPVELVLFFLCLRKAVPQLMTFEGRNFDIISGLSAPFIYYFGFVKNKIGTKGLLVWNFICLGLLINIVVNAVLSAPLPFQQFAFNQPNIALLYFPFVWLPCCVVPLVLLSHLITIRQLLRKKL